LATVTVGLVAATALVGVAGATATPVDGVGTVSCRSVGKFTFSPALVDGGTSETTVTVKAAGAGCINGTGDGAAVRIAKLNGTFTLPTNDCATVMALTAAPVSLAADWRVGGRSTPLNPSVVDLSGLAQSADPVSGKWTAVASGSVTSGSFAGTPVTMSMGFAKSPSAMASNCAGAGLRGLTFRASASTFVVSAPVS
ncbi:MAG: hypothetical protein ACKO2C_06895, partial [Actinomycetes bacterium]